MDNDYYNYNLCQKILIFAEEHNLRKDKTNIYKIDENGKYDKFCSHREFLEIVFKNLAGKYTLILPEIFTC